MRALLLCLVACGPSATTPPPTKPAPPVPVVTPLALPKTCTDAAFGIDRAAKDLHPPEQEIVPPMRARCAESQWSQASIDCFAALGEHGDVADCVATLPMGERAPLLVEIRGAQPDETAELAAVVTKLGTVTVGIASCDRFVAAVTKMMDCIGLEASARIQLGTETVEAWNLPMDKVSLQGKAKLAGACTQSLESLKHHATELSCTL